MRWLWVVGLGYGAGAVFRRDAGPVAASCGSSSFRNKDPAGQRLPQGVRRSRRFLMTRRAYYRASPILGVMFDPSATAARRCRRQHRRHPYQPWACLLHPLRSSRGRGDLHRRPGATHLDGGEPGEYRSRRRCSCRGYRIWYHFLEAKSRATSGQSDPSGSSLSQRRQVNCASWMITRNTATSGRLFWVCPGSFPGGDMMMARPRGVSWVWKKHPHDPGRSGPS